jgi:hypothetical protein
MEINNIMKTERLTPKERTYYVLSSVRCVIVSHRFSDFLLISFRHRSVVVPLISLHSQKHLRLCLLNIQHMHLFKTLLLN